MSRESISLKVQRADHVSKVFYVEYEGKVCRVKMAAEQVNKELPETIDCIVEKKDDRYLLTQNLEPLLKKHYYIGQEAPFKVEKVNAGYYVLKDDFGYTTFLWCNTRINPSLTPKVMCRITNITEKCVHLELIEKISIEQGQFTITAEEVSAYFQNANLQEAYTQSITELLISNNIIGSFDSECHRWIHGVFLSDDTDIATLRQIRESCKAVLETTDLLRKRAEKERDALEERFTTLIEQIGYYIHAVASVEAGKEESTIDELLMKLQKSGYAFHAKKRFYIMMCIFLIKSKDEGNTAFLDKMMPKVFATLHKHDLENWSRQPFKLVWIRLLEFFIQSLSLHPDRLVVDETALHHMVQSLAIQYNLMEADDEILIDSVLNLSMLYRYCSMVGVVEPMKMLDLAYHTLLGDTMEEPRTLSPTDTPIRLANVLYNEMVNVALDYEMELHYEGAKGDIHFKGDTITIVPKSFDPRTDQEYHVVPTDLGLWGNLQVVSSERIDPIGKKNRKLINGYKRNWAKAQRCLDLEPVEIEEVEEPEDRLQVGETISIIVTRQIEAETPTFECRAVDGVERGYIRMADMVSYATPSVGIFSFEKNGRPLIFEAQLERYNEDGTYQFEAKQLLMDYAANRYEVNYGFPIHCVVTGGNTLFPFQAVNEHGIPVWVTYPEGMTPIALEKGTVIDVYCNNINGDSGMIYAEFNEVAAHRALTLAEAFGNLMRKYAEEQVYEASAEEENAAEVTITQMEKPRVQEVINIIDRMASLEKDYIKAYNYLGFCKAMAKVIENEEMMSYFQTKMTLIELLANFDANNELDAEAIQTFEEANANAFTQYSTLQQQFKKLKLVSYLGKEGHNAELWETINDASNPETAELADLILSYNLMSQRGVTAAAELVQQTIKNRLDLKSETAKKDYGSENHVTEFKTSMLYPADNGMQLDVERQARNVMKGVCAFLNAEGGTLYIGVDDRTHLECGLEEDLKYFEGSRDKFDLHVRNMMNNLLGLVACRCVTTDWDREGTSTDVYVMEIKPSPKPIALEGVYYERNGASSCRVNEQELNDFLLHRAQYADRIEPESVKDVKEYVEEARKEAAEAQAAHQAAVAQKEEEAVMKTAETEKASAPYEYSTDFTAIQTSRTRAFLHKDDDLSPNDLPLYINIWENNTYSVTDQKQWGKCLSIGLYDEETEGHLVVVFENGEISKISIPELLETPLWEERSINNKQVIRFVSPALSEDVLSVLYRSGNHQYYRFLTVDEIDRGTFNTAMRAFYTGAIDEIVDCEIVKISENDRQTYRNILDKDADQQGGISVRLDGQKAAALIQQQRGEQ